MSSATDGWVAATASVRDLMAEADLHADEAGGDFAGESERLGAAVASDARRPRRGLRHPRRHGRRPAGPIGRRCWIACVRHCRSSRNWPRSPNPWAICSATWRSWATVRAGPVPMQRIHGDLHLGQVLRTVYRWVLIDFEGEPMAAIDSRRTLDFAIRDVAGMLRSFEYAGYHRVVEFGNDYAADVPGGRVGRPQPRRVLRRLRRGRRPRPTLARCPAARASRPTRPSTKRSTKPATVRAGCRSRSSRSPVSPTSLTKDDHDQHATVSTARPKSSTAWSAAPTTTRTASSVRTRSRPRLNRRRRKRPPRRQRRPRTARPPRRRPHRARSPPRRRAPSCAPCARTPSPPS